MQDSLSITTRIKQMFSSLTFDEGRHLYFWKGVRVPLSVTRLVESHAEKFDVEYWAPKCIAKEGVATAHEVKHAWQTRNKDACDLGHETHDYMEYYDGLKRADTPQKKAGVKYLIHLLKDYDILFRELRCYSKKYNIAGTLDLLVRHKITGKLAIIDYKTNKDLFKQFGMLLPPFEYLGNHPFSKYQLQLSYYQLFLEEIGIEISERIVVHLMADEEYKTYSCYDFTKYLTDYLTHSYAA